MLYSIYCRSPDTEDEERKTMTEALGLKRVHAETRIRTSILNFFFIKKKVHFADLEPGMGYPCFSPLLPSSSSWARLWSRESLPKVKMQLAQNKLALLSLCALCTVEPYNTSASLSAELPSSWKICKGHLVQRPSHERKIKGLKCNCITYTVYFRSLEQYNRMLKY